MNSTIERKLIGIEVLDASEIMERKIELELPEPALSRGKGIEAIR